MTGFRRAISERVPGWLIWPILGFLIVLLLPVSRTEPKLSFEITVMSLSNK